MQERSVKVVDMDFVLFDSKFLFVDGTMHAPALVEPQRAMSRIHSDCGPGTSSQSLGGAEPVHQHRLRPRATACQHQRHWKRHARSGGGTPLDLCLSSAHQTGHAAKQLSVASTDYARRVRGRGAIQLVSRRGK